MADKRKIRAIAQMTNTDSWKFLKEYLKDRKDDYNKLPGDAENLASQVRQNRAAIEVIDNLLGFVQEYKHKYEQQKGEEDNA